MIRAIGRAHPPVKLTLKADPAEVTHYTIIQGEGLHEAGSTVTLEAQTPLSGPSGTRYIFVTWQIDGRDARGNPIAVTMDTPHEATYNIQYQLTVASDYGDPKGSGWYDSGSTATFSVTPSTGTLIQQVFVKWTGDLTATTSTATIVMDSPKSVRAVWRTDYTQLFAIAGAIGVVVVTIVAVAVKKRT